MTSELSGATFTRDLTEWYRSNGRSFPWRQTRDPYRILIAEILLQRTPYWKVLPAYEALLLRAPTPAALSRVAAPELEPIVRPLGLITRAQALVQLGRTLVERHGGIVPREFNDLLQLPGVGRYSASAVRCHAFGVAEPLVDGLTGRVYRRLLGLEGAAQPHADKALWSAVAAVQPRNPSQFHLAMIDLASLICRRGRPLCASCPLAAACLSHSNVARVCGASVRRDHGRSHPHSGR